MRLSPTHRPRPRGAARPRSMRYLAAAGLIGLGGLGVATTQRTAIRGTLFEWGGRLGYSELGPDHRLRQQLAPAAGRWFRSALADTVLPTISLDIGFQNLQRLRTQRQEALDRGILIQGDDDYVSAQLRSAAGTVPIRVRLKGDNTDHLVHGRWAFRIHTRGTGQFLGMRRFSMQHPQTRDFHGEILYHASLRYYDVLAPRYFFVQVRLNGDRLGRYAIEEHFSKELLEAQRRREGVIVRFDESPAWEALSVTNHPGPAVFRVFNYQNATVTPFRAAKIAETPVLTRDLKVAGERLRGFVAGRLDAGQVFDAERLGRFLALSEAWGSWHALAWNNLRFYFNPMSARLEPIGFDANVGDAREPPALLRERDPIVTRMLASDPVRASYRATLVDLTAALGPGGRLRAQLDSLQNVQLSLLHRGYPLLAPYDLDRVATRATNMQRALEVEAVSTHATDSSDAIVRDDLVRNLPLARRVRGYLVPSASGWSVEWHNLFPPALRVTPLGTGTGDDAEATGLEGAAEPFALAGTPPGQIPRSRFTPATAPPSVDRPFLYVVTDPATGRSDTATAIGPYFAVGERPVFPTPALSDILRAHPFLEHREPGWLDVAPGTWHIPAPVVLPADVGVRAGAGTTLTFGPAAYLVARGPLFLQGSPDRPVRLGPRNPSEEWPGLVVLHAAGESRLRDVVIEGTAGIADSTYSTTGGVTFVASDVELDRVRFERNRAEDALNIMTSSFRMIDVDVSDARSDGVDVDFSDGTIAGGRYARIGLAGGGDAIDVSGGRVRIVGTTFDTIGDKAISVGEGSTVFVDSVSIVNAVTGAVSKDRSFLRLTETEFSNIRFAALMAYVKKREYGPAVLVGENLRWRNVSRRARAQSGSRLTIDGVAVRAEPFDVDSLYATVMRRGEGRP